MKKMSILVPAAVVTVLLSAMVLASPRDASVEGAVAGAPDCAAAYHMAMSN
jgi:hypothetical protein